MATYLEKATLATDADFIRRISHAVVKFASYILSESETAPNHKVRARWAQSAIMNSQGVATSIASAVTLNPDVDYGLGAVLDADLQTAVEQACEQLLFM